MDPAAPHYDRPPPRKPQPSRTRGVGKPRRRQFSPAVLAATRGTPPSPFQTGQTASYKPPVKDFGSVNVKPPKPLDRKGSAGKKFSGLNFSGSNGKQIGFYNATHVHGKPMKGLLSALKARRGQGSRTRKPRTPSTQPSVAANATVAGR